MKLRESFCQTNVKTGCCPNMPTKLPVTELTSVAFWENSTLDWLHWKYRQKQEEGVTSWWVHSSSTSRWRGLFTQRENIFDDSPSRFIQALEPNNYQKLPWVQVASPCWQSSYPEIHRQTLWQGRHFGKTERMLHLHPCRLCHCHKVREWHSRRYFQQFHQQ